MQRLLIPALLALGACAAPPPELKAVPAIAPAEPYQGDWRLVEVLGRAPLAESTISVRGKKITGQAPCNSWFAKLVDDGVVLVSPIAATRMSCPQLEDEQDMFGAILSTERAERAGDRLSLIDQDGEVVAVFEQIG